MGQIWLTKNELRVKGTPRFLRVIILEKIENCFGMFLVQVVGTNVGILKHVSQLIAQSKCTDEYQAASCTPPESVATESNSGVIENDPISYSAGAQILRQRRGSEVCGSEYTQFPSGPLESVLESKVGSNLVSNVNQQASDLCRIQTNSVVRPSRSRFLPKRFAGGDFVFPKSTKE